MTQLSLFSRAQLAEMRDRTKAKNYCPDREAFRRDHKRRRDHGKALYHARRIYEQFQKSCPEPASLPPSLRATAPPPRPRTSPTRKSAQSGSSAPS